MDDISSYNASSWGELVRRGVLYSRPYLDLTPETARERIDPFGFLTGMDLQGKDVLCLAAGGGQQSAVFALLGAKVDVLDLTDGMLDGDRKVAEHYGFQMGIHQGDMRDLSRFSDSSFDIVWQPYSINFIPDPSPVLDEVARVLRPGGWYHLQFHNPFLMGMAEEEWNGSGYPIRGEYKDGEEIQEPDWTFEDTQGNKHQLRGPRAFRHSLGRMVNELGGRGFVILGMGEEPAGDINADPGSWDHFVSVCPQWLTWWMRYLPNLKGQ